MPGGNRGDGPPDGGGIGGEFDLAELIRQVEAELEELLAGIDWGELEAQLAAVLETDLAGGVGPPPLGGG